MGKKTGGRRKGAFSKEVRKGKKYGLNSRKGGKGREGRLDQRRQKKKKSIPQRGWGGLWTFDV